MEFPDIRIVFKLRPCIRLRFTYIPVCMNRIKICFAMIILQPSLKLNFEGEASAEPAFEIGPVLFRASDVFLDDGVIGNE